MRNSSLHGLRFAEWSAIWYPARLRPSSVCILVFSAIVIPEVYPSQLQNPSLAVLRTPGRPLSMPFLSAIHLQCSKECWDWSRTYLKSNLPPPVTQLCILGQVPALSLFLFCLSKFSVTEAASCPLISILLLPFTVCVCVPVAQTVFSSLQPHGL